VGAHKSALPGDLAKHRIEDSSIVARFNGVHPYKNSIHTGQLFTHLVHEFIIVDSRFGCQAGGAKCLVHAVEAIFP